MGSKQSQVAQEWSKFVQAFWVELPAVAARNLLNDGGGEALRDAGWKAYDAWINLTNEATNQLYENPSLGSFAGRTMETALRIQQAGSALASAFFGNLWPAIGLPTHAEIEGLRTEIAALRHEVIEPESGPRDAASDHRSVTRSADGLKVLRHAAVTHERNRDEEDAAA
jgi:hypothetical protein